MIFWELPNDFGEFAKNLSMHNDYIPAKDCEFNAWAKNLCTVAAINAGTLGLDAQEASEIKDAVRSFCLSHKAAEEARLAAVAAISTKRAARKGSEVVLRRFAQRFQADGVIPDSLILEMGLPVRERTRTQGAPSTPKNLSCESLSPGIRKLRWDRNFNSASTIFIVEARLQRAADFSIIGTTTKSSYLHESDDNLVYRVRAQRRDLRSCPSLEVEMNLALRAA